MADKATLLAEAYRRGLLTGEKKTAYEEAMRRGIVPKVGAKPGGMARVAGVMANFNRALPLGDELVAGLDTATNFLTGKPASFSDSMATQRGLERSGMANDPIASNLARGTGMAAGVLAPGGQLAQGTRLANIGRGAVMGAAEGAVYGATDEGDLNQRLGAAKKGAALGAVVGGAANSLAPATRASKARNVLTGEPPNVQILKDHGVALTPGQSMGGLAKSVEDVAMRAPILGPAIRGARGRGGETLNRAWANSALESIGEGVPKDVKTGFKSVEYVADRLGKEYDRAADLVQQVGRDAELTNTIGKVMSAADELPSDVRAQFKTILKNRLDSVFPDGAAITGKRLREIQSDIGRIASDKAGSPDEAQRSLGHLLEDVSDGLKDTLGRHSPEAGEIIAKANQGWAKFVRLRAAASRGKDGIASPAQFSQAVRSSDKSAGKGNVAKGNAVGQELANAASVVMPDAFGNPGTADAMGLGALGVTTLHNPVQGASIAAGLGAAATPYMLMGRRVLTELPKNASRRELEAARDQLQLLARADPAVDQLLAQVVRRLGVSATTQERPSAPNILATDTR